MAETSEMVPVSRAKLNAAIEAEVAPLLHSMPATWSDEEREYAAHLHRVAIHLQWTDPAQYAEIQERQALERAALSSPAEPG